MSEEQRDRLTIMQRIFSCNTGNTGPTSNCVKIGSFFTHDYFKPALLILRKVEKLRESRQRA